MNILIIGAGYAGTLAALRLAGKTRKASITLVNGTPDFIQRIRLHELASGKSPRKQNIARMVSGKKIAFVQGKVTAIDPAGHQVTVQTPDHPQILPYDKLVYALGSFINTDAVPGAREHAFSLNGEDGTLKLQAKLAQNPRARVIVCGGGLTGIELTSEMAESYPGLSLTLVTREPLGPNLSRKGYAYLHSYFAKRGVNVREGITVQEVLPDGVLTTTGERIPADFTIWLGSFAVSSLARESGFEVNRMGQITVDQHLRSTSHPDVFAVGDAAASGLRMACATAMPQGAHAADNLAAILNEQPLKPFRFAFGGRCVSLGRHDGLVQSVNPDDSPREQVITGRAAAVFKELICRYTLYSLQWTRHFPNAFMWTQTADAPQLPQPAPQRA